MEKQLSELQEKHHEYEDSMRAALINNHKSGHSLAMESFRDRAVYLRLGEELKSIMSLKSIPKSHTSKSQEDVSNSEEDD